MYLIKKRLQNNEILTIIEQKFKVVTDIFFGANIWHTYPPFYIMHLKKVESKILIAKVVFVFIQFLLVSMRNLFCTKSVQG